MKYTRNYDQEPTKQYEPNHFILNIFTISETEARREGE